MSSERSSNQEGKVVEVEKNASLDKLRWLASYREGDDISKIENEVANLLGEINKNLKEEGFKEKDLSEVSKEDLLLGQKVLFEDLSGGKDSNLCMMRKRLSPRVLKLRQLFKEEESEVLRRGRDSIVEEMAIMVDDLGLNIDDDEDYRIIENISVWAMGDVKERIGGDKKQESMEEATKTLKRMDRREGKKLVTEALRKEGVKDEESWRKWYERRLEKAYTDITLGGKQYSYEEFKSNFEIIIKESGQKFDGLRLMEDGYSELSESLERVTRSMWKLHCNGVATFDKRKNFMAILDLRKGERPDGYKWYDLGADDFENFKKLNSSGQISKAFALYLRLGTTVYSKYSKGDYKDPESWQIKVKEEIYRNPWTLNPLDDKRGESNHLEGDFLTAADVKKVRKMVVRESGSVFAENVALSLIYATDLSGAFGARFKPAGEWGCASRRLYYPFLELERAGDLNEGLKIFLNRWGGMELSFMKLITDGQKVSDERKEVDLMEFWLKDGFDKVDYVGIGFGGTGAQTSGFLKAAKLFDLMKAEHEGGKILSQDNLRACIDLFGTSLESYPIETRYQLQGDWLWYQLRRWEEDQRAVGVWNTGKVERGAMTQIIRGALRVGFLTKDSRKEEDYSKKEDLGVKVNTFNSLLKRFR